MMSSAFDPANDELIIARARKEIVFIEDNVADIDTLIKGIGSGKEVVVLDSTRDGLHQIAEALAGRSGVDALHIVSHGAAGTLNLGAVTLDANELEARHDELQAIGQSLRTGGDILLYGCSIGADGRAGQGNGFIESLAIATGADVAASSNRTGSEDLGGDWNLEVSSGQVETAAVVDAKTAALYHGVLATGLQNKTVTFSNYLNFANSPHVVSDGPSADVVYRIDGNGAYSLVIDGAKNAVVAYDFGPASYVNVAGLPDAYITENSVSISFTGGKVFTISSLEASRMGSAPGENLTFTGVDSNNQVHTTSATLLGTNAVTTVNFSGFTDIKTLTITTPDNGGVFKFFSLDNLVFSNIQAVPVAPVAPSAPDLAATSDTGNSNTDNVTNKTTGLVFTGTNEAGVTAVKLYEGSTEIASTSVISGTTYTVTTTGTLSEGAHTITAKAVNAGGTASSASSSLAVTVDTTAPSTTIASAALSQDSGTSNSDMITRFASQTLSGTLSANLAAGERVMVSLDNGSTWSPATASAGTNTWQLANVTLAGSNTLKVKVEDLAGNGGTVYSHAYSLDTTAPTMSIGSDKPSLKVGETATITFTFSEDPGTSFAWNGSSGDIAVSGGTLSALSGSGTTRTATFTPTAGTDSGTASISVTGINYEDAAGNTGANASLSFSYDTLAPNTPSAPVLAGADDKGASSTDGITNKSTLLFSGTADPGATVRLYDTDGTTQIGSGSADGAGAWNITTSTLAAGTHTIKAKAFDAAGNVSGLVSGQQVVIDTAAPTLTVTSFPSTLKAGETATITFTFSEDPGTSFSWDGSAGSITVSGGTLSAISGSGTTRTATFTPSADTDAGSAGISVSSGAYHDLAGNDGAASNNLALSYDTLAPSAPGTPALASGDDSGASSSDGITNDNTLSFSGSAANGTTVKLYDGATQIGSVTASGGTYTIPVAGLGEGSHTLTAVAYDAAGNASTASGVLALTVDQTPPTTTVAGAALSNDSGASNSDMVTKIATQTISGTLSANLAAGERVMVSLDNGATWNPATASAGTNTWELANVTLAGSNTLKVKVEDLAGNGGTVYSHAYTLDQVAPSAPSVPDLDAASDSGSSDTDNITGVTVPSFSGTADVGAIVRLYDGGIEIGSVVAVDGTWQITTGNGYTMGPRVHYITAEASDLAGNAVGSSALEVTVRAAPTTTVASVALSSDAGTDGDFITNVPSQTISGLLSANLAAGERVEVSLNGGASWNDATAAVGSKGWSIPATLSAGAHDIKVRVTNDVDVSGPVLTQGYTLDSAKPAVSITSDVSQLKIGDTANITFSFTKDPGTSFDGADISVSGGTLSALSGTGTTRTAVFTPSADTNGGTASITIKADSYEDAAGNLGSAGAPPSLIFDTLAPAAPSTPDLDAASDKGDSSTDNLTNATSLTFKGTAEAGATVKLYDSDGSTEIGSGTATGGNWNIATSTLGMGSHSVTAKVFDAAGNVSAASSATAVTIDTTAPTLVISSDASQLKIGETATITFTFSEDPGATFTWDGTAGDVTVSGGTLSAISGTGAVRTASFTPSANTNGGAASISVSAGSYRDAAGNDGTAGATPTLHFDTLAPGAPSTPDLDTASDTGSSDSDNFTADTTPTFSGTAESGAMVTLYDGATAIGSVVAAGGAWQITSDRALSAGVHSITAQAVDAAGNAGAMSSGLALQIITSGPATGVKEMALSLDSGTAGDFITNTAAQTISGLLDAVLAAGERVQVSLDGGTAWNDAVISAGSDAWSIAATLSAGAHDIRVRVIDAIDNTGPVHIQAYTLDSAKPAVSITSNVSQLKIGDTANITFSFTKDPGTSFDGADISVSGGTLSALSGTGTTRTAVFTPSADTNGGTASISIDAGKYEDIAGNAGLAGNSPSITFDTLAPAAASAPDLDAASDKGASSTDNLTNATSLTFKGTAEAGATVKLYDSDGSTEIGSGTATGGNWTIATSTLGMGSHSVTAKVFDAAGNVSAASSATTVTIDTTAPTLVISSDASQLKIGETATITFTFSEDPGATFTWDGTAGDVTVSGGTLSAISGTGAVRTASFTPSANTNGGAASISVSAGSYRDAAGNDGTAGATPTLHFDTLAPAAPSTPDLDTASDTGSSDSDNFTADTTPTFSGTAESGATVTLYDGATAIGSVVAAGGTWQITSDRALSAGVHSITAQAVDAAGNAGAMSSGLALQIITSGPATGVKEMALSLDSGTAGDFITNTAAQTISGLLDAVLAAGERVQVSLDGGTAWNDAVISAGSDAWSIAATLSAGAHDIRVRVIDAIDNTGPVHIQAYTLDSAKPAVSITSDVSQLKIGDTANITFSFTKDPGTSFDGADISVSGGTLSALSGTGTTRTAVFTPSADTNAGTASISIKADSYEDAAGNLGSAGAPPSLSFDTLAPAAPSTPDLDAASDKGDSSTDNLTNATSLTFKGTAEAGATVKLYDSDGSTEIGSGTATGGNWTIATSTLGMGSHSVTAKVFDAAGNVSAASSATAVTIDTTAPTLVISSDASQLKIGETATITFTFSEDPGATFTWDGTAGDVTVSGGTLSAISGTGAVRTASFTPSANTNGGAASISVSAGSYRDAAGNDGTAGATPTLHFDTLAPAAPSTPDLDTASDTGSSDTDNFTADTTPTFSGTAESGATVTLYDGAIAIGSVVAAGGTWQITSDRALSAGVHSITAQAVDAAGNAGAMSSGLALQIITSGPATGVKEMALSLDSGTAGDFITNTAAQTISGLLDAVLAAGERVQVSLDGGTAWNDAVISAGSDAWSIAATLSAGAHDIRVRVIDAIDNTGPVHIQAYTLDSAKPVVSITSDVSQLKIGDTANITFSFTEDPGTSFDAGDIEVSGGTLSALSGTGATRTAVFTPSADTNAGTASISIKADSYEDAAGNLGSAGAPPSLSFDTLAPAAPSTPDLHKDSDSGPSDSDDLTHDTALVLTGTAEDGATVRLYDSDGSTEIGHATAAGGVWTITTLALAEGSHAITAKAFDAAGNASAASGAITVTVDTSNSAALAAPVLDAASDSGALGDAITKTTTPTFSGSAEALAQVTLYDGATAIGSVQADAQGAWQITAATLPDGVHAISARQVDLAGNASGAGAVFSLTVDTVAPAAPAAPSLKASSDTGSIGDGLTENTIPVIEGTALADTLVTLYETVGGSKVKLGAAMADGSGKWSIATTGLSIGAHQLSATQSDAAGNESAASAGFTLRIEEAPMPIDLVDGMPVQVFPISLPGNVPGIAVSIPVVGAGRAETSGQAGVADIPLVKSGQGVPILLAQLPVGYGLSASGANLPAANAGELLIAAIKAATPSHAPADQGHLTGNGQSFLAGLASSGSLLVETVKPVSSAAPDGVLTLSGPAPGAGQSTALVIDAGGLAAGATVALQQVNFAAVIGAANVTAGSGTILSGDGASQHFTVAAGGTGSVFAGGGSDVLSIAAPAAAGPAPAAGVALLHGGAANDAATFSGARADYNIEFHNGYVMVSTKAAPDVKSMVVNVEQLQFSDASIAVQNNADMGTLAGIYQTVLGRQADVMGIEYWADVHQAGASWGAIALSMIASSEHAASHEGFNGVAAHDLALLYAAVFNREADAGGMAYWTAALGRGLTLEQVASSFVESAEMVGHQRAAADWDFIVG